MQKPLRFVCNSLTFAAILTSWVGSVETAHADSATCSRVAADLIVVDGLLDDWSGIAKSRIGPTGKGADDASLALRCGYDDKLLYLAVRVFDNYVYRGKRPSARKDDHLAVALSATPKRKGRAVGKLTVFPGKDKINPRRTWNGKAVPGWLEVEDTLQRRGWSLELAIPRARIRGLNRSAAGVFAHIQYHDADFAARVKSRVVFEGTLAFEDSVAVYRSFLEATGLSRKDIRLDQIANVDDTPGSERVLAGGKIVGVLGDRYAYMELPVRSPRDVFKVMIADLRGDGTKSIITKYRQFGNGGSRDVVAIWNLVGNGKFERLLAFEVRKQLGQKVLQNHWSLVPTSRSARRGKKRGKKSARRRKGGHDLIIEVTEADARGWDEDNYHEAPAVDVRAILTPWSDQTSALYSFEGNSVLGGGPAPAAQRKRR